MTRNEVKTGVILSYILILVNTVYGLFLTPYIVGQLGEAEYGVYKIVASLSSSLMVLDFGIGSTVMRYVANYRAKKEEEKIPNFVAMSLIQAAFACAVVLLVCSGLFFAIRPMYVATLTPDQIRKAQLLFAVLTGNMLLHILENVLSGVITGSNRFTFGNGMKLARLCLRIISVFVLLQLFSDSMVLVLVDIVITAVFLIAEWFYIRVSLGIRIRCMQWEKAVFAESGKYTALMFLTSVAAQVNNNLDNVIIGAISGPELVTVYSMGLLIFAMFENLSTSVSGVMLPTVSNLLEESDGNAKMKDLIIRVGRIQFVLLGAAAVGFLCVGKEFVSLWLGAGFEDVYLITVILMLPSLFELCVNVCLAVLRAKNMLGFRTGVLFATTALNALVTAILVKHWSYIGAAFGTAASFLVGSLIVMNIYYHRKLGLPMLKIYRGIVSRTWLCLLVAGVGLYVISRLLPTGWIYFLLEVVAFCVIFALTMLLFGFSREEKRALPFIGRFCK